MDTREAVREFLASRRAKITPEQAGLPNFGGTRRVPGLRRAEVAMLAGVSPDSYTRLEKGNLAGASDSVLDAIARALRLDDAERSHLFDLARAAGTRPNSRRRPARQQIRPGVRSLLDAMTDAPAFIRNGRLDILAVNPLGEALYAAAFDDPARPVNLARFCFLDPSAQDFYPSWQDAAHTTVALLRTEAGRDPYDKALTDLVGELATRSDLTKPGCVSTARWRRSGERDGEEYARNRCCKAPQRFTDSNLVDAGREQRVTAAAVVVGELPGVVKPVTGRLRGRSAAYS
jgi:transcriptional regulator with XRE-family HTH domain